MADAAITRLSALKAVAVRPTSAVGRYVAADRDPIAIGRRLRVDHVIDAAIQHSGDRVPRPDHPREVARG